MILRNSKLAMVLIVLLTVLTSEFKVIPFSGEDFRFGLGSITFFLLILIRPPASLLFTGFITGLFVVIARIIRDVLFNGDSFWLSLGNHAPAFLFYFLFALGLRLINVEKYKANPFLLGALGVGFEFIANGTEHLVRNWFMHEGNLGFGDWALLLGVAVLRSYFVVGLYSSIAMTEQKKRMEEMLGVNSELYAETLYLQKSMNHIEQITASSHDLYQKLKQHDMHVLSVQALHITQEIHEVKKDSQRILAGLKNMTEGKKDNPLHVSEVLQLVIHANEKYSQLLMKHIHFSVSAPSDFETDQQVPLLALLNNIVANSVEAIMYKGEVHITMYEESSYTCFLIKDSGKGILEEDIPIIFEPGYTTKYNDKGVAATGIGLSHVQEIIQTLSGKIQVEALKKGTVFKIQIPTNNLRK
ncbi:sensor histidine kinase [Psychrobacillus sp. OK032]|uniref:sensor histidine kinase n=1 Tax=Psychrobacillus sp. OK032 TaxID=1884358 RepID=UPI0008BFBAA5|nr:sensor histidine kinase [Psychrobacillus sp. OK032]SES40807.1 two-component system, sensor histidine kinase YcbA [Psychrobacillus sp. OK032]